MSDSGWQPISSAPKDGTHVIVGTFPHPRGHITVTVAHYWPSYLVPGDGEWALSVNWDGDHSNHGVDSPTHWMPLPPPPVTP